MKDYIASNKEAWEEAFDESKREFRESMILGLKKDPKAFFTPELAALLADDASGKAALAHFCCNNGRETMAALSFGYQRSVGFDIAENMIAFAKRVAQDLKLASTFHARSILDIGSLYEDAFDTILFTVGGITWFKEPKALFGIVARCLKKGGTLIIEDAHPFTNQLAIEGETVYDGSAPRNNVHDYFRSVPWIEQGSMGYMTGKDKGTKTFTSYSHTLSSLLMGLLDNGLIIEYISENQVCQGNMFDDLNHSGIPLTYLLQARKHEKQAGRRTMCG